MLDLPGPRERLIYPYPLLCVYFSLSLSLCCFSFLLSAANFSGRVTLGCTNNPLRGIPIVLQARVGFNFQTFNTVTDGNGDYSFSGIFVINADDFRLFIAPAVKGKSQPLDYDFPGNTAGFSNANFQFHVQPPMRYGVAGQGIDVSQVFPPISPSFNPTPHCLNSGNCLFIPDGYAQQLYWRNSNRPEICFTAEVYELTFNGNRGQHLGTIPCVEITAVPQSFSGCARYAFDFDPLVANSIGENVEIEITQNCCEIETECPIDNAATAHTWSQYFTIGSLSQTTVDFAFNVSSNVDADNPGDDPFDLMEPRSSTIAGAPAIGCRSSGISTTVSSPDPVESITYKVYEVDCNNSSNNPTLIVERELELDGNAPPSNYSFIEFEDENGEELLCPRAGQAGKCFLMEVIATNECGSISEISFFTVNQNFNRPVVDGTEALFTDTGSIFDQLEENQFAVFPNPVNETLNLRHNFLEGPTGFQILSVNGAVLSTYAAISNAQAVNISTLPADVYFIRPLRKNVKAIRFVKL